MRGQALVEERDSLREARLDELRSEVRKGLNSRPGETWDAAALKKTARAGQGR
jgi:antitoxin ParD1/3/4